MINNINKTLSVPDHIEYWGDIKYYIKQDLRAAWDDNNTAYLAWAVQCAHSISRAKYLLDDLIHDLKFPAPDDIFRCLDFCQTHNIEITHTFLGESTQFSIDVVREVVKRLPEKTLKDSACWAVYRATVYANTAVLEYFDTLFDLRDIACKLRNLNMIEAAQAVDVYVVKRSLAEHTQYCGETRCKKM